MFDDPRDRLPFGVHRATVIASSEQHNDYPSATDDASALLGAMIAIARQAQPQRERWVNYTIEGCGDWVYRLTDRQTSAEFIDGAIARGWFECERREWVPEPV